MAEFINVARSLSLNGSTTTDQRAITQTLLDTTIAEAFEKETMLEGMGLIGTYNLAKGESSHDFPLVGNSPEDGEYYVTGSATDGGSVTNNKINIGVDDIWYKQLNIPMIDLEFANWDLIAPYARDIARIMAERRENVGMRMVIKAARTAALTNIHPGGTEVKITGSTTVAAALPISNAGADALELAISNLARQWDEKDIPRGTGVRKLMLSTHCAQVLTYSNRLTNREVIGANVDISNRSIGTLHGFDILGPSRFFPTGNVSTDLSKYNLDSRITNASGGLGEAVGVACCTAGDGRAVQFVTQGGLKNKMWTDDETMDTSKMRSSFIGGWGIHCPWKAGIITVKES